MTLTGGELGAVEATYDEVGGQRAAFTSDNGATWGIVFPDAEIVYQIEGDCELLGANTNIKNLLLLLTQQNLL